MLLTVILNQNYFQLNKYYKHKCYHRTFPDLPGICNKRKDKLTPVISQVLSRGIFSCCYFSETNQSIGSHHSYSYTKFIKIFSFTLSLWVAGNLLLQAVFVFDL